MRARLQSLGLLPLAALSATSSLMCALGAPPQGITWLIWFGFWPVMAIARTSAHRRPRQIFMLGWIGGLCTGLVGFPWIAETLERFGDLPPWLAAVGLLLFSAWTAVPFGFFAWGVSRGPQRGIKAVLWPLVLWIALTFVWPALFPYTVVIGIAEAPPWMQVAELGGVPLVVTQVVLVGVLLADATLGGPTRARLWRGLGAVAVPVVSGLLGMWRLGQIDAELAAAPVVRVGIVQPNTALEDPRMSDRMRRLRHQSAQAGDGGAQLVVWPEAGAFPFRTRRPFARDFVDPYRSVLRGHGLPTIFGAGSIGPDSPWEYNTVYAMAADGTVTGRFDKVILVPLGEYVPWVDPTWAIRQVPSMSHNNAGQGPARFVVQPRPAADGRVAAAVAVGPLICYEDIFAGFAHTVATQPGGIDLFVNVTIDTWFGDTAEPWEHLALAQFRSVEHRIPMVRSVAAGVSGVVDAGGRLVAHIPVRGPTATHAVAAEHLLHDVRLGRNTARRPTVFGRVGWMLPWLCTALVLFYVLAALRRTLYSRRANNASTTTPESGRDRPGDSDAGSRRTT